MKVRQYVGRGHQTPVPWVLDQTTPAWQTKVASPKKCYPQRKLLDEWLALIQTAAQPGRTPFGERLGAAEASIPCRKVESMGRPRGRALPQERRVNCPSHPQRSENPQ